MNRDLSPVFVAASMIRQVADELEQEAAGQAGPRGYHKRVASLRLRTKADEVEANDTTDRVECWRCGYLRPTFESCPECGGSCKPLTKQKQREWERES